MIPAPILASYHFFKRTDLTDLVQATGAVDLFADSGAFSAHNSGAVVSLADYCSWLVTHARVINFAAALDVIGSPALSRRNADIMRSRLDGAVTVVPTFHVGSPWNVLAEIAQEYPFVALGGAVEFNQKQAALMPWLVKAHKILRAHGAVAHGFGLTKPPYPAALPWYSVDSSYWTSAVRTGSLALWDGRQFAKFRVGARIAGHNAAVIRAYGGDPGLVAGRGFGLAREHGDRARVDRRWMQDVSAMSYWRYNAFIRARRHVPAPPGVTGDGPKLYLAAGDAASLRQLVQVWSATNARTAERRTA